MQKLIWLRDEGSVLFSDREPEKDLSSSASIFFWGKDKIASIDNLFLASEESKVFM